jgi:hypothetical protein
LAKTVTVDTGRKNGFEEEKALKTTFTRKYLLKALLFGKTLV